MGAIRDLLLTVIITGLVPVSLFRPWYGILGWFWISYFVPQSFAWSFGRSLPVAMLVGGATLVGFGLSTDRERRALPGTPQVILLSLFIVHITVTTMLAYDPELAWGKWSWVTKELLMTFVMMCLFQDRLRLRCLYMVPAVSLGFWGLKGAIWVLRTGGGSRVYGPSLSFWGDNNTVGLTLSMALPLLLYLSREESHPWRKRMLRILFGASIISIIFTYSRGAFLALVTLLAILIWRSPWRLRFAVVAVIGAILFAALAPEQLIRRFDSIRAQESAETRDDSARGRIEAWTTSWNIATAHPFAGEGFRALWNDAIWNTYFGYNYLAVRDTHSVYFEVLSEHGFVGFGLYVSVLVATLLALAEVRRRWRGHPEHGYLSYYAEMTQLSLYPFLVAGTFLSFAYFDLLFLLVGTSSVLQALSRQAEQAAAAAPPRPPALAVRATPDGFPERLVSPRAKAHHA
jgi:putative inorganic carbon (HCO3(-)) transporter